MFTCGTFVTKEPQTYYDGRPVENWPSREYIGEIIAIVPSKYMTEPFLRVHWANGTKTLERGEKLIAVSRPGGSWEQTSGFEYPKL
jgi:hypothetical protein